MNRRNFLKISGLTYLTLCVNPENIFSKSIKKNENWISELEHHKIDKLEYADMHMKYPRLVGKNAKKGLHGFGPNLRAVVIKTNQGAEGFGQLRGSNLDHIRKKSEFLIGKKITDIFDPNKGILTDDVAYFDVALHDLCGNILNKPCYEIFGRKKPFLSKVYSGMIYFDDLFTEKGLTPMEQIAKNIEYDYQKGYRQFKLKIGRGAKWMQRDIGLQRDIDVTRLVFEKYPDCEILVDANDGYSYDDLIRYLENIKDIPLFWIEEPFLENEKDLRRLRNWLNKNGRRKTLIADGEYDPDFEYILELGRKKVIDVNLLDVIDYGFTRCRDYMPIMKEFGMQSSPHAWGSLNKTIYAAHLAGGYGNVCTIEGVTCTSEHVDFGNYQIKDGLFIPPSGNGWGMKLLNNKRYKLT